MTERDDNWTLVPDDKPERIRVRERKDGRYEASVYDSQGNPVFTTEPEEDEFAAIRQADAWATD